VRENVTGDCFDPMPLGRLKWLFCCAEVEKAVPVNPL
jgi:hypothetical protein